ncbi:MAG: hypothetical protein Q7T80_18540 [Methanoregula sp.]|nr:hypothetical protein [Methanoregula sp.]
MHRRVVIVAFILCIAFLMTAGCTGTGSSSIPPVSTPAPNGGSSGSSSGGSSGGTGPVFSCTVGTPEDSTKAQVLEITQAQGQGEIRDIFNIRVKIKNNGGDGIYTGVTGKSCDRTTGKCSIPDHASGTILKPYETVDFTIVTMGGCPALGTENTCSCEARLSVIK